MEKEAEEERVRKQRAATERAFQEGITKTRLVMRRTPLGMDRNHNRSGSSSSSSSTTLCLRSTKNLFFLLGSSGSSWSSWSFPSRYWLFSDVVPGLYIEKGWVHESIDYSFTPPPDEKPAESETHEEEEDDEEEEEEASGAAHEGATVQMHTNVRLLKRRCTKGGGGGVVVVSIVLCLQGLRKMTAAWTAP